MFCSRIPAFHAASGEGVCAKAAACAPSPSTAASRIVFITRFPFWTRKASAQSRGASIDHLIVFSIDPGPGLSYGRAMPENATFFTVFARWPDEVRLFSIEWEMIETTAEALAAVRQNPRAVCVFRHDPDGPHRDVSEDIARRLAG